MCCRRGRKVVAQVDVRNAHFNVPARGRVFVELPPDDYQPRDEHMSCLLQDSLCGTREAAQFWEGELTSTLSDLKLTRGIACPCLWRGCIVGGRVGHCCNCANDRQLNFSSERYRGIIRYRSKSQTEKSGIILYRGHRVG